MKKKAINFCCIFFVILKYMLFVLYEFIPKIYDVFVLYIIFVIIDFFLFSIVLKMVFDGWVKKRLWIIASIAQSLFLILDLVCILLQNDLKYLYLIEFLYSIILIIAWVFFIIFCFNSIRIERRELCFLIISILAICCALFSIIRTVFFDIYYILSFQYDIEIIQNPLVLYTSMNITKKMEVILYLFPTIFFSLKLRKSMR